MKNNSVHNTHRKDRYKYSFRECRFLSRRIGIPKEHHVISSQVRIAFPLFRSIYPHRRSLQDHYELLYPSFTQHISHVTIVDLVCGRKGIVFSNSIEEGWMARTVRRSRRPQRLPKIVVRASRQLGFMSPINSCDFADRFSDLESRLPISLSLSFSHSLFFQLL